MKTKFTPLRALLLLYLAQFLMATDCTGCDCQGTTKYNVVYSDVELTAWDTSKFQNKIVEGTVSKNAFGIEISVHHDYDQIASFHKTNNTALTAGFGFAYAWSCDCVVEHYFPDPIAFIRVGVTDVVTQNEIDITTHFTTNSYDDTALNIEALLEQYKEEKQSYLNWQLDLTNTTDIPDSAVFTLVVTLESGITFTQQTDGISFSD